MGLGLLDLFAFFGFIAVVVGVSLYASRKQDSSEDYFLAGRNLTWWLIGFSLIASNISTEHFVGMAGEGFSMGLAIASYEWIAAITLVFVALVLLPMFLRAGIYTIPEFLEYRFNEHARALMAFYMMVAYVIVAIAAVLYSGALALNTIFDFDVFIATIQGVDLASLKVLRDEGLADAAQLETIAHYQNLSLTAGIWLIGILAGAYTVYGGLKAVVWSDLIQGATLLIGGILVTILGFVALGDHGGVENFFIQNSDKFHTLLPADHPKMPWTIMLGGIWIPNIFYWGLNQFITQRTLGAKSLAEGQRGIMLAAGLKLLIPFIIVFPGIMAYHMFADKITNGDMAYPFLIREILPAGLRGIMLAALFGAVMSSLDSMLNSTSTIFTMDIYKRYIKPEAEPGHMIKIGRIMTGVFVVIGCLWAPMLLSFEGVFTYIQMVWGFISPGIVAVFIFGLAAKRAPGWSAVIGLAMSPILYPVLHLVFGLAFLNAMVGTVLSIWVMMAAATWLTDDSRGIAVLVHVELIQFLVLWGIMDVDLPLAGLFSVATFMVYFAAAAMIQPLEKPVELPETPGLDLKSSRNAKIAGAAIVIATVVLYIIFR